MKEHLEQRQNWKAVWNEIGNLADSQSSVGIISSDESILASSLMATTKYQNQLQHQQHHQQFLSLKL
jgi:hypothetical protein